jgi:hypothetical protein
MEMASEAYVYCQDDNNDAFTNAFRKYIDGEIDSPALTKANFISYKNRRAPGSDNVTMRGSKRGFSRIVFLRYVPTGVSTPETREAGLKILAAFFKDSNNSRFPPKDITTMDGTNVDNPRALDSFFMDSDIVGIIHTEFEAGDLNGNFYETYPAVARSLWAGQHYPDFARSLGFP